MECPSVFKILLLLLRSAGAELICSRQPITALVGDDVILPCHLKPAVAANFVTVVWTKPGLEPKYVHVQRDRQLMVVNQNPSYYYRTRLFVDELTNGNVSVKIFKVKISDAGKYLCILESLQKKASIQLTVGAVSTPVIQIVSNKTGKAVLQCESEGWYPKPKVSWLDGDGNVIFARPTNTSRGPDGLYSVSSRVTVNMLTSSNSKSFTCTVKQKNINQTREATIHVPADFLTHLTFYVLWSCTIAIIIVVIISILVIGALVCIVTGKLAHRGGKGYKGRKCRVQSMQTDRPHRSIAAWN